MSSMFPLNSAFFNPFMHIKIGKHFAISVWGFFALYKELFLFKSFLKLFNQFSTFSDQMSLFSYVYYVGKVTKQAFAIVINSKSLN
jgi:hypothetical protein